MDISVIIPTRDRADRLARCLSALDCQSYPADRYEIIVVNDGGATLDAMRRDPPVTPRLTIVDQANAGPAAARNAGAARAQGALLAFTDDDCEPDREWLSTLAACHAEHPEALVGGQTVNGLPGNSCSAASQLLVDYVYSCFFEPDGRDRARAYFTSNNMAVPAGLFRTAGGFDGSFPLAAGEDRELCVRWQGDGRHLRFEPKAVVRHSHALSVRTFWRQHMNYGRGAAKLRRSRPPGGDVKTGFGAPGFYLGLLMFPLGRSESNRLRLVALLLLSQVANALGFWVEWRRDAPAEKPRAT